MSAPIRIGRTFFTLVYIYKKGYYVQLSAGMKVILGFSSRKISKGGFDAVMSKAKIYQAFAVGITKVGFVRLLTNREECSITSEPRELILILSELYN